MPRYRWVVLSLGVFAQMSFAALAQGLPAIGPALRSTFDLSLAEVGFVLAALTIGTTLTLIAWGLVADRIGERWVLAVGLIGASGALVVSLAFDGVVPLGAWLLVAGMLGSVASVASGRAVMSWFDAEERGLALGIRQTGVPFGGAVAALSLPALVAATSVAGGVAALAAWLGLAGIACLLWLRDPPRPPQRPQTRGPITDGRIWRLSLSSALLVFTQIAALSFVVLFLHDERGLSATAAGGVLAAMQIVGGAARIGVGIWSDRLGTRIRPLRYLAVFIAAAWICVPFAAATTDALLVAVIVVAGAAAVSWNGLSFTAAAEYAGPARSGTALGIQQTVLFAGATVVAPAFGLMIDSIGWTRSLGVLCVPPVIAWVTLGPLSEAR